MGDGGGVADIGGDASDASRYTADPVSASEQREIDASGDGEIGAGSADDPGPADEEHSHEESCTKSRGE